MQQIIVRELYFVVEASKTEFYRELPQLAYLTFPDAIKALDNREGWEIKSYYYMWNVITRNLG